MSKETLNRSACTFNSADQTMSLGNIAFRFVYMASVKSKAEDQYDPELFLEFYKFSAFVDYKRVIKDLGDMVYVASISHALQGRQLANSSPRPVTPLKVYTKITCHHKRCSNDTFCNGRQTNTQWAYRFHLLDKGVDCRVHRECSTGHDFVLRELEECLPPIVTGGDFHLCGSDTRVGDRKQQQSWRFETAQISASHDRVYRASPKSVSF